MEHDCKRNRKNVPDYVCPQCEREERIAHRVAVALEYTGIALVGFALFMVAVVAAAQG